jgi:asparagine synthase (glutamine-hydrolysing)
VLGQTTQPDRGLDAMRRGADARGVWTGTKPDIWLGHRRLSIQDLSAAGAQPMVSPDGRYVMIYNGEIYNTAELRSALEAKGETFVGHSDTEIVLRLFALSGHDSFARLNGIFAAAIWDRQREELTLVRDPLGVKPLYFVHGADRLAFASEIKALILGGDVTPQLHPRAVLHHLGLLWSPGRETIVAGVEKLLPGEVAVHDKAGNRLRRWRYSDVGRPQPHRHDADADALARELADTLDQAVERQLISDVPLGSFLSGGLDSSSIVAAAVRHMPPEQRLQCFSIEVASAAMQEEGFADDLPYARRVADHLNVDLHVVRADETMVDRVPEMMYFLDEPTADLAALNTLMISELAYSQGIKVLLSGSGGDDIFTGYRRHVALEAERYWSFLPRPVRRGISAVTSLLPASPPLSRRIAKAFQYAGDTADERLASYFYWLEPAKALALLDADFAAGLSPKSMGEPLLETLADMDGSTTPLDRLLYLERRHFLADHNLNYADKMGMATYVEIRVPLLDHELVQFAATIPDAMKQRGSEGKWLFKKAMEPYLPRDVIYRPKTGFGVPLRRWLFGPLQAMLESSLSVERLKARGVFDPAAVRAIIDATRSGQVDASYTIFAILCLELWCGQFIDGHFAVEQSQ